VATNGDHVIAVARREDRLRELAADHDSVTPLVADLTAPAAEQRLETAIDAAGGLDILVNNAGYGLFSSVEQAPDSEAYSRFADFSTFRTGPLGFCPKIDRVFGDSA
jgi:short-subunit dehydrogenase